MVVVGCDVSKAQVDVCVQGEAQQFFVVANDRKALKAFARQLPEHCLVGMESTSTYHELLADTMSQAGHTVFVVNARWIRAYAKGLGMRGKTDRNDALVIARYVRSEHAGLHAYQPPTPEQRELRTLLQRRLALAKIQTAARASLGEQAGVLTDACKSLTKDLERRIQALMRMDLDWLSAYERLQTMPGVGPLGAAYMVSVLKRIPFSKADAFIAHTGTDPRPNDSGKKLGRRKLTHHGDANLRCLLFMAAMGAIRKPQWRAYYQTQRAKGLASTAALMVVARRIARIAFSLYKSGELYDPAKLNPLPA